MSQITTEITSSQIASDNPIHQRLLYAYEAATQFLSGKVLEVGCGEGRGIDMIKSGIAHYTALDKNKVLLNMLSERFPSYAFIETNVPPFTDVADNFFDCVIAFQVIEHIQDDKLFVKEIHRVLKPGGKALISTPNIALTLTRNPWHVREYTWAQLSTLLGNTFSTVNAKGITGDATVWDYYNLNKESVKKITRWDIFGLQHKLPASWLQLPYDILNRRNRNKMMAADNSLVSQITTSNYTLSDKAEESFDLFFIAEK